VDGRPSDSVFWEEAFAWAPFAEDAARAAPDVPAPGAARTRAGPEVRRARRLARSGAARRRRRTRLYPPAAAATVAAVTVAVAGVGAGGADPGPERRPAALPRGTPPPSTPPPAAVSIAAVETADLRMGDQGEAVRALQYALLALGFDTGVPDGSFEAKTRDALAAFQRDAGFAADGVVGPVTARALAAALGRRAAQQASVARDGLAGAVRAGRLPGEAAARYVGVLDAVLAAFDGLTLGRAANLGLVLDDVAAHVDAYDEPRSLALFTMLEANAEHLTARDPPEESIDVAGDDGVVYRFFRSRGFQFHPIANFAALNRLVTRGEEEEARRLATALVARGVPDGEGLVWEYYFPFGGPARWTSGFAQAVAADSLSRAGTLVGDDALVEAARRAFRAIPGKLARRLADGLWIREYGFSDMPILNAQLQTLVSLSRYAETASDAEARTFAAGLDTAARNLLHRFDHGGCWSLYSLDGGPATVQYHRYHLSLLELLAERTGEQVWRETAGRWRRAC
jgi:hypothetical protein